MGAPRRGGRGLNFESPLVPTDARNYTALVWPLTGAPRRGGRGLNLAGPLVPTDNNLFETRSFPEHELHHVIELVQLAFIPAIIPELRLCAIAQYTSGLCDDVTCLRLPFGMVR